MNKDWHSILRYVIACSIIVFTLAAYGCDMGTYENRLNETTSAETEQ